MQDRTKRTSCHKAKDTAEVTPICDIIPGEDGVDISIIFRVEFLSTKNAIFNFYLYDAPMRRYMTF
jgi:hypothetical protein